MTALDTDDTRQSPGTVQDIGTSGIGTGAGRPRRPSRSAVLHAAERWALLAILAAVVVFFAAFPKTSGTFATTANAAVVAGNQAVVAVLALALLFPLIAGHFDFSVGANAALSSVLCAALMSRHGLPLAVAVTVAVALGAAIGAVNGLLVARLNLNAFVTTLGASTVLGGAITWYTKGQTISTGISPSLTDFGSATLAGLPRLVYLVLALAIASWYLLAHTPYGRWLYAIGANARSARLVGIRTGREVAVAFLLAGALAGVAGVLQTARTGGATADSGVGLLFPALAAVFLGATAVTPGRFNVVGSIIGVLLVASSVSGLTLSGAAGWVDPVFNGAALLLAVGLSTYLRHRRTGAEAA